MRASRLLIIDDEADLGALIARTAAASGYEVFATTDPAVFEERVANWQPTHIVLDLMMPGLDGVELMNRLAADGCKAGIVIISGVDHKVIETARRLGTERGLKIEDVFIKPFRMAALKARLEKLKPDTDWLTLDALADAMDSRQLILFYQPKINLGSGDLTGFEALVRWQHPVHGMIAPARFIPLVEHSPLIGRFTGYVLATACDQIRIWNGKKLTFDVAINISAKNIGDSENAALLEKNLREQAMEPNRLVFELTESAAMGDALQAMGVLAHLRLKGIRLSIDDFGTGYSSLVQLQRMPFTEIKIDRGFVAECTTSGDSRVIVKTIVDLAHNLGLKAVAEGIESEAVLDYLAEIGCDEGQGYYISKPMPADDVAPWIKQRYGNIVRLTDHAGAARSSA